MNVQPEPAGLSRDQVESRAAEILHAHGLNSIPIDPVELANREGIKVHNAKFSEPNIAGLIAKRGTASSVLVENDDSPYRKRFTIAHELAHYFLHLKSDGEFVDTPTDLQRASSNPEGASPCRIEVEANQFAAALLMPAELVKQVFPSVRSVEELARLFRVSREAMAIRLGTLGLA
jgi:Zn-dependent peptidase ImmA (M78 family)